MRERPPLPDNALAAALAAGWGMAARAAEFLPVGDDAGAWPFRVIASDGIRWFLKVRRGPVDPAAVLVPRFLHDHGLEPVVAAVPAADGERDPWRPLDGFTLLVYPWVEGVVAMERRLTGRQWAGLGRFRPRCTGPSGWAGPWPRRAPSWSCATPTSTSPTCWSTPRAGCGWSTGTGCSSPPGNGTCCSRPAPNGRGSWRATGPSPWTGRPWPTTAGSGWCRSWPTYGGRVLDDRLGDDTRRHALEELRRLFGDVVEVARRADQGLMVS
jgi:hypothetical protein